MNELSKIASDNIGSETMDAEVMVTYPTEAFLSKEYLEAEKRLLWPKIWQMVERETDLPNPGDWMTYDVAEESIIVLRKDDGSLKAFHNVCPHRGRQLVSVPDMVPNPHSIEKAYVHDVRGNNRKSFVCGFHGWTFDRNFGSSGDRLDNLSYMHQRYTADDPHYSGRVTVPTPGPARKTRPLPTVAGRTVDRISAPWVTSGSSPASLTMPARAQPSPDAVVASAKAGVWPPGSVTVTGSGK